jgi:pimeloyl-ACP methyl ester carboxylesterase
VSIECVLTDPRESPRLGHSLGGAYAQRFTQRFADQVAALLLLEPAHADYDEYMPDHLKLAANSTADLELPELTDDLIALARTQFESGMLDAFPDHVRRRLIDKHTSPKRLLNGVREGANVQAIFDELRAGGPLPDVPLIVLSRNSRRRRTNDVPIRGEPSRADRWQSTPVRRHHRHGPLR